MKHIRRTRLLPILALLSGFMLPLSVQADTDTNRQTATVLTATELKNHLVGSWEVTLDSDIAEPNPALYSFMLGGILTQTENPMVVPGLGYLVFSNAHGAWKITEEGTIDIRYFKLVYQADGSYWGKEETIGSLKFSNDGKLRGNIQFGNNSASFIGEKIKTIPNP